MKGVRHRLLALALPAFLTCAVANASGDSESYVQGIYIKSKIHARPDWTLEKVRPMGCDSPDPFNQAVKSEWEEYYALVGGQVWMATYIRGWDLVPPPMVTPEEIFAKLAAGQKVSMCPARAVRPSERVYITNGRKFFKREPKTGWIVWQGVPPEIALFAANAMSSRIPTTRLREESVQGVKCTVYRTGIFEFCLAERESLKQQGITWLDRILLWEKSRHPETGTEHTMIQRVYIDFKAKIPLSRLFPPKEVMNRPPLGTKEANAKPGGRGVRVPSRAGEDDD